LLSQKEGFQDAAMLLYKDRVSRSFYYTYKAAISRSCSFMAMGFSGYSNDIKIGIQEDAVTVKHGLLCFKRGAQEVHKMGDRRRVMC
jgi:hypothetical protein